MEIIFEDPYYTEWDIKFLREEFIVNPPEPHSPLVNVRASNNGSGWNGIRQDENAYAFITLNLTTPLRQVLAGHTWGEETPHAGSANTPRSKKPSLIICRPPNQQFSKDQSDTRFMDWLEKYSPGMKLFAANLEGVGSQWAFYLESDD